MRFFTNPDFSKVRDFFKSNFYDTKNYFVDADRFVLDDNLEAVVFENGMYVKLSDRVLGQILTECSINSKLLRTAKVTGTVEKLSALANDIRASLFGQKDKKLKRVFRLSDKHNYAKAYVTGNYAAYDNFLVIEDIKNHFINHGFTIRRVMYDDVFMKVDLTAPNVIHLSDSKYYIGLSFINDEASFSSLKVVFYLYREVCSNGMIITDLMDTFIRVVHIDKSVFPYNSGVYIPQREFNRLEIDKDMFDEVRRVILENDDNIEAIKGKIEKLKEIELLKADELPKDGVIDKDTPVYNLIENMGKAFNISRALGVKILENVVNERRGKVVTLFDVVNGITEIAHNEEYAGYSDKLEEVGGKILFNPEATAKALIGQAA